jgi:thiamine biosynthesis lipoprotein
MSGPATASARWRALGCDVDLVVTDASALAGAREMLRHDLHELDLAASRFRPDSEVARLARADGRRTPVSSLLADLLAFALDAAARSGGDLDPTLGSDLAALGYDRDFSLLPGVGDGVETPSALVAQPRIRRFVRWSDVELDREAGTVRAPAGTVLDLGATAKAHVADLSAARLAHELGCGVLVGLGGDVAVAGEPPAGGWVIRVQDSTGDPGCPATGGSTCLVALVSGGLATSSTAARRWRHAGSVVHHILDPRTGGSADRVWRTVSVVGPTCREANVASTTAIVRGRGAPGWLRSLRLAARLVPGPEWTSGGAPLLLGGWPTQAEVA